jgi:hypothetical protein
MVYTYGVNLYRTGYNVSATDYVRGDNTIIRARQHGQHCVPLFTSQASMVATENIQIASMCGRAPQYKVQDLVRWETRLWVSNLGGSVAGDDIQLQAITPSGVVQAQQGATPFDGSFSLHGLVGRQYNAPAGEYYIVGANSSSLIQYNGGQSQFQSTEAMVVFGFLPRNDGTVGIYAIATIPSGAGVITDTTLSVTTGEWHTYALMYTQMPPGIQSYVAFFVDGVEVARILETDLPLYVSDGSKILMTKYHGVYRAVVGGTVSDDAFVWVDYDLSKFRSLQVDAPPPVVQQQ